MALDNVVVLENLKKQKAELEQQLEAGKEMYLKVLGAIDVVTQLVESDEEVSETEVVE